MINCESRVCLSASISGKTMMPEILSERFFPSTSTNNYCNRFQTDDDEVIFAVQGEKTKFKLEIETRWNAKRLKDYFRSAL